MSYHQHPSFSSIESVPIQTPVVPEITEVIVPVEAPVLEKVAPPEDPGDWYDLDKLAKAVCTQETHCGKDGVGKTKNNVCGIRRNGTFESYGSIEEAMEDCKSVLLKYKPWTIEQISKRYTTTEQDFWATNVQAVYNSL